MTGSTELSPKSHYAMRVIGWTSISGVRRFSVSTKRPWCGSSEWKRNRTDGATLRTHYGRTRPITRRDHSLEVIEEGRTASDEKIAENHASDGPLPPRPKNDHQPPL